MSLSQSGLAAPLGPMTPRYSPGWTAQGNVFKDRFAVVGEVDILESDDRLVRHGLVTV